MTIIPARDAATFAQYCRRLVGLREVVTRCVATRDIQGLTAVLAEIDALIRACPAPCDQACLDPTGSIRQLLAPVAPVAGQMHQVLQEMQDEYRDRLAQLRTARRILAARARLSASPPLFSLPL